MDGDNANIQNEFFNAARKERSVVMVYLTSGKRLVGRIRSFDKFTVLLEGHHGDQIVFKHAISTVSLARHPVGDGEEDVPRETSHAERRVEG